MEAATPRTPILSQVRVSGGPRGAEPPLAAPHSSWDFRGGSGRPLRAPSWRRAHGPACGSPGVSTCVGVTEQVPGAVDPGPLQCGHSSHRASQAPLACRRSGERMGRAPHGALSPQSRIFSGGTCTFVTASPGRHSRFTAHSWRLSVYSQLCDRHRDVRMLPPLRRETPHPVTPAPQRPRAAAPAYFRCRSERSGMSCKGDCTARSL